MKQTMVINGISFEVEKPISSKDYVYGTIQCETWHPYAKHINTIAGIYEAYRKPSKAKVNIYSSWLNWAKETDGVYAEELKIWISSATAQFFTISGYAKISDKLYAISITAKHNRISEII